MLTRRFTQTVFALLLATWAAESSASETVFLSPHDALALFFSAAQKVDAEKHDIDGRSVTFYVGRTKSLVTGYAIIDNQIGKTEPITYLVGMTPQGKVARVEILVYRETHGLGVRSERFTRQFVGKGSKNPLKIGEDLANVSGATISARAIADGVKRDLAWWERLYGKSQTVK